MALIAHHCQDGEEITLLEPYQLENGLAVSRESRPQNCRNPLVRNQGSATEG